MRLVKRKDKLNTLSDEVLMQAIQNGDCMSFDELYKRYNERIYYYFHRMLGFDHQVAEDFTQDLFLKLIHKPAYFDTTRKFSTWIFSLAHNLCKNEYRSRAVRSIISAADNADSYVSEEESKEPMDKNIDRIFKALDQMDDNHKTVFLLKYREGFSIDEINEITELPKGTIKSRLHYTRKKLQEQLTPKHTL